MSRILKNIIDNVLGTDNKTYCLFHGDILQDLEIVKLINGDCFSFKQNKTDINNIIKVINPNDISNDLSICPRYVVNTTLMTYQDARNFSELLRIPLINIIDQIGNIKKEGAFTLANLVDKDINLLRSKDIGDKLYLTNYTIFNDIKEIPNIIENKLKTWMLT